MVGLHARSTSTCAPDLSALRPRTPNNDSSTLSTGDYDPTPQWHMMMPPTRRSLDDHHFHGDAETPQIIQPLMWQVPQQKNWQLEEPLLELKEHAAPLSAKSKINRRRDTMVLGTLWFASLVMVAMITHVTTKRSGSVLSSPTVKVDVVKDRLGSFEEGYPNDLESARSAISVHQQQFYGSLDFKNRHGFIPAGSPSQRYVGAGDAVDSAWDELTHDRYFLLSDSEAQAAYGDSPSSSRDDIMKYWNVHHGGFVAGLDVMHTLHCLNHLRMGLYPEVYPQDPEHSTMHKAHCIDHLRQLAMCHSDLTPVPTQWFEGLSRNYINSSREHTCRDFSLVREWADERFNGSTAVKPRNKDGSPREEFLVPWTP